MCSFLPIGHLEAEWRTCILCSFFAAVGGIQISKSLHLNLYATRSQDWLWCLLDMWASKTSWIKVPAMGRLCLRNFFCSSDLKIFLLAKCSLTSQVGHLADWRSLNNTWTAIALHWERFYPSNLKKVNCSLWNSFNELLSKLVRPENEDLPNSLFSYWQIDHIYTNIFPSWKNFKGFCRI